IGTEEEQAKNFQWGLRRSTFNHLMCIQYTDVAQVSNVARNYEILHEWDDDDTERPDKWQKSGDRHQPTSQQSSHRNHGHNNSSHGSDRRGGSDNHRSSNNNYSGNNNRNSGNGCDQRNRGQQSNRSVNSGSSGLQRFFHCAMFIYSFYLCYSLFLYPFTERYAQPYFFSCLIRQMVNTCTDADLSAAIQNALQTLLSQIHAEIREEFRTSSGPSDAGGNPPPVTIHTWLERFNKQKPRSF
nr:zinc finger, CCHC-type, retrotransposon Gag domain protein [Tanacetum cinerariifolium]